MKIKAAGAFNAAAFCLRGPAAKFNFPVNPPVIPAASFLGPAEIQAVANEYGNDGSIPSEQEQSPSELTSSSLVSDEISINLNPELDRSFLELLTVDSGEKRSEFEKLIPDFDQFAVGYDFPVVDFGGGAGAP